MSSNAIDMKSVTNIAGCIARIWIFTEYQFMLCGGNCLLLKLLFMGDGPLLDLCIVVGSERLIDALMLLETLYFLISKEIIRISYVKKHLMCYWDRLYVLLGCPMWYFLWAFAYLF